MVKEAANQRPSIHHYHSLPLNPINACKVVGYYLIRSRESICATSSHFSDAIIAEFAALAVIDVQQSAQTMSDAQERVTSD
jgi:hypothetical protein